MVKRWEDRYAGMAPAFTRPGSVAADRTREECMQKELDEWRAHAATCQPTRAICQPSAAALISTWRQRIGVGADFPLHVPTDVERAMVAEIAELRALVQVHEQSAAGAAPAGGAHAADMLVSLLWLYARLPRHHGCPQFIEGTLRAIAGGAGMDVNAYLAGRMPAPLAPSSASEHGEENERT